MASGSITTWQIKEEKMEAVTDFIFLGSKITVDVDCSHEIQALPPWKKSYGKPKQHICKGITLPTKVPMSKLWFFQ